MRAQRTIPIFLICCFFKLPTIPSGMYPAAATLLQRQIPLSSLSMTAALIWEPLLTWSGSAELCRHFCYTQCRYFSEGVCSSSSPVVLHHSQTTGSAVFSVGKSTGRRLWVKLLQRASQKDCDLLLQKLNLGQHIHSPLDPSHVFSGVLYPERQQRGTSRKIPTNAFHLWDFHTWQLLPFLHNHLFSLQLQSPLNHNWRAARLLKENAFVQAMNYISHKK